MRSVTFEGLVNFRDLGGLPTVGGGRVRRGRLYRSDSVAHASTEDARRLLHEFGLAVVIDLRGANEVALLGRGRLAETTIRYRPAPIDEVYFADTATYYLTILERHGPLLAEVVRDLADPAALPAVVHCEAGCDRTGVFAAVVLGLVGVPDADICADYAMTATAAPAINARIRALAAMHGVPLPDGYADGWFMTTVETMAATLAEVRRRWGSLSGWAGEHGLGPTHLAALRAALVESG